MKRGVLLLMGDCLEKMAQIPDASVNLIVADLPYGTTACAWDSPISLHRLWEHYSRLLTPTGTAVFTASQPFSSALVMSNPGWFKYELVWRKNRATGHVHAKNKPMKQHEVVLIFSRGTTVHATQSNARMTYNPQGLTEKVLPTVRNKKDKGNNAVLAARKSHKPTIQTHEGYPVSVLDFSIDGGNAGKDHIHETQKPIALMEYLVRTYSNEGETVLDNVMGSGTTGVACVNSNRCFIGIEKEEKYFNLAEHRIAQARGVNVQEYDL